MKKIITLLLVCAAATFAIRMVVPLNAPYRLLYFAVAGIAIGLLWAPAKRWLHNIAQELVTHLFFWSGSKMFKVVSIYNPSHSDDEFIRCIHFAENERVLNEAIRSYAQDLDERLERERNEALGTTKG